MPSLSPPPFSFSSVSTRERLHPAVLPTGRAYRGREPHKKENEKVVVKLLLLFASLSFVQNFTADIPRKALVHAITPASRNATALTVPTSGIFLEDAAYYYKFYFMEVLGLASRNKSRSFNFLIDGIRHNGDPIVPPYQSYLTDYNLGRYLTAGSNISLVNTANASFPPILNAMEVFKVQRGLANGANEQDGIVKFILSNWHLRLRKRQQLASMGLWPIRGIR
ncbi:hypothetical protein EJ110_NYTH28929 [Nymphaea thermarum]|nr:hypothetical protein EJ110_NYTH28929 [Nymphaea thermarum]